MCKFSGREHFVELFSSQICLVLIFIVAVIIYRTLISIPLFQSHTFRPMAQVERERIAKHKKTIAVNAFVV